MTDEELRAMARDQYWTDDCEIDDNAVVSRGDEGAFVAAWVWVRYPEQDDEDDGCGAHRNKTLHHILQIQERT